MGCINEQARDGLSQIPVASREQDNVSFLFNIPTGHSASFVDKDNKRSRYVKNETSILQALSKNNQSQSQSLSQGQGNSNNNSNSNSHSQSKSQNGIDSIIKYPRLILELTNTETKAKVDYVIVTPNAIGNSESSLMHKATSVFSFGNGSSNCNKDNKDNDYAINYNNIAEKQFDIIYTNDINNSNIKDNSDKNKSFHIRDNYLSSGIFMKMKPKCIIKDNMVLSFGNCYVKLGLNYNDDIYNSTSSSSLYIMYQQHNEIIETVLHQPNETNNNNNKKEFKIGRGKECDIIINSTCISRVQCTLSYDNDEWILYDGSKGQCSTNGLWLLIQEQTPLSNEDVFKTGNLNISVTLICEDPNKSTN